LVGEKETQNSWPLQRPPKKGGNGTVAAGAREGREKVKRKENELHNPVVFDMGYSRGQ